MENPAKFCVKCGAPLKECKAFCVKCGAPVQVSPAGKDQPHAAQEQASRLNALAEQRGEAWLGNYGGKISSEWEIPKLM